MEVTVGKHIKPYDMNNATRGHPAYTEGVILGKKVYSTSYAENKTLYYINARLKYLKQGAIENHLELIWVLSSIRKEGFTYNLIGFLILYFCVIYFALVYFALQGMDALWNFRIILHYFPSLLLVLIASISIAFYLFMYKKDAISASIVEKIIEKRVCL